MKKIVIAGAGPGGLAAAIELAKKGYLVTVLEKKPENDLYKICAAGISRADYSKYKIPPDLIELIEKAVVREFDHFRIITSWQSVEVKSEGKTAVTIDRKKLNELMVKKARELGVKACFGEKVMRIEGNFVVTASGHKYEFDHVIGADGSNSKIREILGLKKKREKRDVILAIQYIMSVKRPELVFCMDEKIFGNSYGWIFPWGDDIGSVGTGKNLLDPDSLPTWKLKENLGNWIKKEIGPQEFDKAMYEFAEILVDYKGYKFEKGKYFLAGDSAGFANKATGGGIMAAIGSALDIAETIIDPKYDCRRIKKILKAKKNSERFLQLMASPLIGRPLLEAFVFLLQLSLVKRMMGSALM